MAIRGANTTSGEERAAALHSEAETLRARVPEAFRPAAGAGLGGAFPQGMTGPAAVEPPAETPAALSEHETGNETANESETGHAPASEPAAEGLEAVQAAALETAAPAAPGGMVDTPDMPDAFEEDDVSAVHEKARETDRANFRKQENERDQEDMGIASQTGAMTLDSIGINRNESAGGGKAKKKQADRFNSLMATLNDYLDDLYDARDHWQAQYERYDLQERALDKYIEGLESGQPADLTAEEQRAVDQAIREYEEENDVTVDRNNAAQMRDVLELSSDNKQAAQQNLSDVQNRIDEAKQLRRAAEVNPNDPSVREQMEELGLSETGTDTLVMATADSSNDVKVAATQSLDEDSETKDYAASSIGNENIFGAAISYGSPPAESRPVSAASNIEDSPIGESLRPAFASASDPAQPADPSLKDELDVEVTSGAPAPGGSPA